VTSIRRSCAGLLLLLACFLVAPGSASATGFPLLLSDLGAQAEVREDVNFPAASGPALAAFALIGLAVARRRRGAAVLVAGASLVFSAGNAQAVSLSDGDTNVEIGLDGGNLVARWFLDDVLHVTQGFALSLDDDDVPLPMADVQMVGDDTATLTFSDGPPGQNSWLMSITFELEETAAGADLAETVTLANLTPDSTLLFGQVGAQARHRRTWRALGALSLGNEAIPCPTGAANGDIARPRRHWRAPP